MALSRHTVGPRPSGMITEADFFRLHKVLARAESPLHHLYRAKTADPSGAKHRQCRQARHHVATEPAFSPRQTGRSASPA